MANTEVKKGFGDEPITNKMLMFSLELNGDSEKWPPASRLEFYSAADKPGVVYIRRVYSVGEMEQAGGLYGFPVGDVNQMTGGVLEKLADNEFIFPAGGVGTHIQGNGDAIVKGLQTRKENLSEHLHPEPSYSRQK